MNQEHLDPASERLWQEFHRIVNMTGEELRAWLLTDASGEQAFVPDPDLDMFQLGRGVVHVLSKRKVDLTAEDLATMREVVNEARDLLERPRPQDEGWRHALMRLGHDPLRPGASETEEEIGGEGREDI
ncbi:DUF3140 domain-containing protein [Marinactinospora thermotolerans]|uniref:DUF3140 domain-containing protein n=1 Tax=Marinactinospora thermotolerans DSM 45154 TaxID=1122192 RepID=A0A1T4K7V0_9ACTN|nr:DUF3140 domain-containing protein [Marinactinospora thermotolerans]SJZ38514.1 Protein of unknown function [Marinactinospora thermotolerans DSM 45154]